MKLKLGISTCPNDTFAFHAILNRKIDLQGLDFEIRLLDVQQLNEQLEAGALDYSKASFHAALRLSDRFGALCAGAAMGFGVGPILLSAGSKTLHANSRVLCPGAQTTADLLFRCLHPGGGIVSQALFSDIMPSIREGRADFGVVIHEGRFTYQEEGLTLVEDLGESWEKLTGGVVPLGGILGSLSLDAEVHARFASLLQHSIQYSYEHRDEVGVTMRKYAQELDDEVLWQHVELYVNPLTHDLGETGITALRKMQALAESSGVLPAGLPELRVIG